VADGQPAIHDVRHAGQNPKTQVVSLAYLDNPAQLARRRLGQGDQQLVNQVRFANILDLLGRAQYLDAMHRPTDLRTTIVKKPHDHVTLRRHAQQLANHRLRRVTRPDHQHTGLLLERTRVDFLRIQPHRHPPAAHYGHRCRPVQQKN